MATPVDADKTLTQEQFAYLEEISRQDTVSQWYPEADRVEEDEDEILLGVLNPEELYEEYTVFLGVEVKKRGPATYNRDVKKRHRNMWQWLLDQDGEEKKQFYMGGAAPRGCKQKTATAKEWNGYFDFGFTISYDNETLRQLSEDWIHQQLYGKSTYTVDPAWALGAVFADLENRQEAFHELNPVTPYQKRREVGEAERLSDLLHALETGTDELVDAMEMTLTDTEKDAVKKAGTRLGSIAETYLATALRETRDMLPYTEEDLLVRENVHVTHLQPGRIHETDNGDIDVFIAADSEEVVSHLFGTLQSQTPAIADLFIEPSLSPVVNGN